MFRRPSPTLWFFLVAAAALAAFAACNRADKLKTSVSTTSGDVPDKPTFSHDVAPIVFAKCATCHHPGEAAPFSLLTFDDVRKRASQIVEVTQKQFMPPWPPHEGHGEFVGTRRLSAAEIATLAKWQATGAARGYDADLPAAPQFADGWQLGTPDLVLESPVYTLAAGGGDQFRNFVIPVAIDSPRWVAAIELRPTNPRVTHHARLGIDSSYESVHRDGADGRPGYDGMAWGEDPEGQLTIWAPGMVARPGMAGTAWRLQPKTSLVLHTHLQPSGKTETTSFRIGVHFADKAPTVRPVIMRIGSRDIDIAAGEPRHKVVDAYTLPVGIDVHSIFPHAHSLCKEVRVHAELPDGTHVPLIWIEHFDENWHDQYRYVTPVRLPRGTKLITETSYDNTDANIRNRHHPPERTVYGSNVADEMQDVYLQVTATEPDERAALVEDMQLHERQSNIIGFGKTLEKYPQDPWSREGLAGSLIGLGKPAEAIRVLEDRMKLSPAEVHSLAILGMAHFAGGDFAGAEQLQRQAIEKDAKYPFGWLGLGKALVAQKKIVEANQAFGRAVELAPALTDAELERANLLLQQGKLEDAAAACDAARSTAPAEPNVLLKLAEIRTRQGRTEESLKLLTEAQRLAPYTHPPKVLLAVYLFQNKQTDRARQLLAEARAEQPQHPVPAFFLGQLARNEGQLADARRYLDAAAAAPIPQNWPASHRKRFLILLHSERLKLAEQTQDEALARQSFEAWLKCDPENDKLRKQYEMFQSAVKQ